MSVEDVRAETVAIMRGAGCTCDPVDVEVLDLTAETVAAIGDALPPGSVVGEATRVRVYHALECPLCPPEYRSGPNVVQGGGA